MNKDYLGGQIVGASFVYGVISFLVMYFSNTDFHDQILYGMVPPVIGTFIGMSIHVYFSIKHTDKITEREVNQ